MIQQVQLHFVTVQSNLQTHLSQNLYFSCLGLYWTRPSDCYHVDRGFLFRSFYVYFSNKGYFMVFTEQFNRSPLEWIKVNSMLIKVEPNFDLIWCVNANSSRPWGLTILALYLSHLPWILPILDAEYSIVFCFIFSL